VDARFVTRAQQAAVIRRGPPGCLPTLDPLHPSMRTASGATQQRHNKRRMPRVDAACSGALGAMMRQDVPPGAEGEAR
jgi:hypothetical protein